MKRFTVLIATVFVVAQCCGQNKLPESGNVGIGTLTPLTSLDVRGIIRSGAGGLQVGKFGIASNPVLSIGLDRLDFSNCAIINGWGNSSNPGISIGTSRYDGVAFSVVTGVALDGNYSPLSPGRTALTVLGNSNVGIGTTLPNAPLEVAQPIDESVPVLLYGGSRSTIDHKKNMLAFMLSDSQGGEKAAAGIQAISNNYDVTGGHLSFLTSDGNLYDLNTLKERMRIDPAGNVSIGTLDPHGYRLAIAGNVIAVSVTVKIRSQWPDDIFKPNYELPTLANLCKFINKNGHLPDNPSEARWSRNV